MSLFGFPSGLAGGSKETEYLTDWQTNKSTTFTTSRSTDYPTYRSTSQETTYTQQSYNVLYAMGTGLGNINTGVLDPRIARGKFQFGQYWGLEVCDQYGNMVNAGALLQWPASQVVGWSQSVPSRYPINPTNYGVYVQGNTHYEPSRIEVAAFERIGQYIFTVAIRKMNEAAYLSIYDGANPVITNTTGNTSWSTQGGVYQQNTEYGTSGLTDFQTDQLTSHITYG